MPSARLFPKSRTTSSASKTMKPSGDLRIPAKRAIVVVFYSVVFTLNRTHSICQHLSPSRLLRRDDTGKCARSPTLTRGDRTTPGPTPAHTWERLLPRPRVGRRRHVTSVPGPRDGVGSRFRGQDPRLCDIASRSTVGSPRQTVQGTMIFAECERLHFVLSRNLIETMPRQIAR